MGAYGIPLSYECLQIGMDVLLELPNGFDTERMGNSLALAGVLSSISSVEETTFDRDKSIIVFTRERFDQYTAWICT